MLADPFVLGTVVTTALVMGTNQSYPRTGGDNLGSSYRFLDVDGNDWVLSVKHQYGRTRNRFTLRADVSGLVPSTAVPAENSSFSQSCYVVFDCPVSGPIVTTTTVGAIDRRLCYAVGQNLVGAAAVDPLFLSRIVKGGET